MADIPITREEKYLAYLTGDYKADVPKPITRQERYLYELCLKGMGGEISPEEIQKAVNDYLDKNPVKPGATTEQAQQIEQNKKDVASLKESISTKITKFYASSQGETNLQDSDDGKIMDMMLYGKSEQKQYSGKNLFTFQDGSRIINGVTFEAKDGIITAKGTATEKFTLTYFQFAYSKDIFTVGETYTFSINSNDNNLKLCAFYKANDTSDYIPLFSAITKTATVRIPENIDLLIRCVVDINTTVNATATIQIEKGTEATSYEPYTGGIPSPNPSYPQEIKSVVNPTVKVCGKNLLNATLQTTTKNGVTCTANGDGSYTLNGTATKITTFDIAQDVSCNSFRLVGCPVGGDHDVSYELQARTNNLIYGYDTGDGKNIKADENFFIRIRINTGINCNNLLFKPMIVDASLYPDATYDDYEPYHEQTVTLPYTLNAIPVSSGGNVTIGGQQYIADYVDVERGKLVRMCKEYVITGSERLAMYWLGNASYLRNVCCINNFENIVLYDGRNPLAMSDMFIGKISENADDERAIYSILRGSGDKTLAIKFLDSDGITTVDLAKQWLIEHKPKIVFVLSTPIEIDLTSEEIAAFKALATYYPTTNISINSEQLDGYTVFNYPISMENGWNYVKQQIGDTREYIYDMDARTQDTDLQAAEAYVNSEYAVALTELEV